MRDAVWPGEKVQKAGDLNDGAANEEFGKTAVREAMDKRTKALLNGPDGPFNLANVAVRSDDVEMNAGKIGVNTGKFLIPVDVVDGKTSRCIEPEDGSEFAEDSVAGPILDWCNHAETEVA